MDEDYLRGLDERVQDWQAEANETPRVEPPVIPGCVDLCEEVELAVVRYVARRRRQFRLGS